MESLQAVEDVLALGVNVISEISRVNTRICGNLLLIQALDGAQSVVGRKAELAVAFHLQRGKVKQTWRSFAAFLFGDIGNLQQIRLHLLKKLLPLFFGLERFSCG